MQIINPWALEFQRKVENNTGSTTPSIKKTKQVIQITDFIGIQWWHVMSLLLYDRTLLSGKNCNCCCVHHVVKLFSNQENCKSFPVWLMQEESFTWQANYGRLWRKQIVSGQDELWLRSLFYNSEGTSLIPPCIVLCSVCMLGIDPREISWLPWHQLMGILQMKK